MFVPGTPARDELTAATWTILQIAPGMVVAALADAAVAALIEPEPASLPVGRKRYRGTSHVEEGFGAALAAGHVVLAEGADGHEVHGATRV